MDNKIIKWNVLFFIFIIPSIECLLLLLLLLLLYAPWQFVFYDNLQVSFVLLFYARVLCGCVSREWERQSFYAPPLIRQLSYSCCWQNICCPIVYRETVIDKRKRNVAALQRQRHLRSHRALGMWHTCDWETSRGSLMKPLAAPYLLDQDTVGHPWRTLKKVCQCQSVRPSVGPVCLLCLAAFLGN